MRQARFARWTLLGGGAGFGIQSVAGHPDDIDVGVITAPVDDGAVREVVDVVRAGGKTLLFAHTLRGAGCELDLSAICVDEKDLIGSYSSDFTVQREVARLVFSRRLDVRPLITHMLPLEQISEGVRRAACPTPGTLKIMILATTGLSKR